MDKSPDAFRTISEVAEVLETPAHVLRFWETRFPQIKPVKRAGGRRYYRPSDVALLSGIKRLLHDEGLTIRGVQRILRDQGVRHVARLSGDSTPYVDLTAVEADLGPSVEVPEDPTEEEVPEAGFIAVEDDLDEAPQPMPVKAAAQPDLPLFAAAADAKPTPPGPRQPSLRDDTSFAILLRALPPKAFTSGLAEVAALRGRLIRLRAEMAARADGGRG